MFIVKPLTDNTLMHHHLLFLLLLLSSTATAQSPTSKSAGDAANEAYNNKDYSAAFRLYEIAMREDNVGASEALLAAASAFHLGNNGQAKKMLDRAFLLDPIAAVDSYDGEEDFKQLYTTKFNRWFENRLLMEVRSPGRTRANSKFMVYTDGMTGYVDPNVNYMSFIDSGRDLMMGGNYKTAHSMYVRAFRISDRSLLSLTRAAACAFAAGKRDWADAHLDAAFLRYPHAVITRLRLRKEFTPLLENEDFTRWIGKRILAEFPDLDNELIAEIDDLWDEFTTYRSLSVADSTAMSGRISVENGSVVTTFRNIPDGKDAELQEVIDEKCALRLTRMFEKYGFPEPSVIGDRYDQLGHLLKTGKSEDWVKWKPILIEARDNSSGGHYIAAAYDIMLAYSGKPQEYGTFSVHIRRNGSKLIVYCWPIKSMENFDLKRNSMGLMPMKKVSKVNDYPWPPTSEVTSVNLKDLHDLPVAWRGVFIEFRE